MNTTDSPEFVSRSALHFFSGTIVSKLSGMLRDVLMAFFFGTSASLAAFLLAFRFVYLARRLFGESLLHQGFIPHFETQKKHSLIRAALFFRDFFWSVIVFLAILFSCVLGILFFFHGEAIVLARYMLPGIFFICLFGFCTGLLQSEKNFFLPSISPVVSNSIWIFGILFFRKLPPSQACIGLSIVLSLAFFSQWTVTLPKIRSFFKEHLSFKEMIHPQLFSSEIRLLIRPLFLGIIGIASMQINTALDGIFARFATQEGPAYLWYAIRLQQLPLSLLGIAFSSALLPSLSRAYQEEEKTKYFSLVHFSRKQIVAWLFPCMVGIFVLGLSSVNLLFGRGNFHESAVRQTTLCLWCYGIGLLPMALVHIYAPAFYAKKEYKIPMLGCIYATSINVFLNVVFVFILQMGAPSIALATSVSSIFNFMYLKHKLQIPKQETFSEKWYHTPSFRIIICTLLAAGITIAIGKIALGDETAFLLKAKYFSFSRDIIVQSVQFFSQAAIFFLSFFLFCKVANTLRFYTQMI